MADETVQRFFERHPAITKYIATICTILLIRLITYGVRLQNKDPTLPRADYSLAITDTGRYLPHDEPFYVSDSDAEVTGKRYVFVGKLTDPFEYNGCHWYKAQSYLYPNWTCFVASEAELPAKDADEFVRVEGLVCGFFSLPTGNKSGVVATTHPALQLRELAHGDALEMSAPLVGRVEPSIEASSEEGVSVTLDALEYREGLTLAWVTLRNESSTRTVTGDLSATSDGRNMMNRIGDLNSDIEFRKQMSSHFNLPTFSSFVSVDKGKDTTILLVLSPTHPHFPLDFCFSYRLRNDGDGGTGDGGDSAYELVTIAYDPKHDNS